MTSTLTEDMGSWTEQKDRTFRNDFTGEIINDRYTFEEYSRRRVGFLNNHDDYKHLPNLFPIVRKDAEFLFVSELEELCVQEIRAREELHGLKPLLPFPTTGNTQTLDNFAGYPAHPQPNRLVATEAAEQYSMSAPTDSIAVTARADSPNPVDSAAQNTPNTDGQSLASATQTTVSNILAALGDAPAARVLTSASSNPGSLPFRSGNSPKRSPSPTITSRRGKKDLKVDTSPPPSAQPTHPDPSPLTVARPAHRLESVIAGIVQPKSLQQAVDAQLELLKRLIAQDAEATSFRPEFHRIPDLKNPKKVAPVNEEEDGENVSCVCGPGADPDGFDGLWIACDNCNVWQHQMCMGAAVPQNKTSTYECQVCNPYAHRALLQKIRSGEWVKEDATVPQKVTPRKGAKAANGAKKASRMSAPAVAGKKRKIKEEDDDYKATAKAKKGTAARVAKKRRAYN